ncbi:hypothetical protein M885DRAFT_625886 [Pelagophyceae sp. CCMP2097]|nr:hypothetical protein M885DRAFT_625886 [Pelagophyceae sp. CCMP2097]
MEPLDNFVTRPRPTTGKRQVSVRRPAPERLRPYSNKGRRNFSAPATPRGEPETTDDADAARRGAVAAFGWLEAASVDQGRRGFTHGSARRGTPPEDDDVQARSNVTRTALEFIMFDGEKSMSLMCEKLTELGLDVAAAAAAAADFQEGRAVQRPPTASPFPAIARGGEAGAEDFSRIASLRETWALRPATTGTHTNRRWIATKRAPDDAASLPASPALALAAEADAATPRGGDAATPRGADAATPRRGDVATPRGTDAVTPRGGDASQRSMSFSRGGGSTSARASRDSTRASRDGSDASTMLMVQHVASGRNMASFDPLTLKRPATPATPAPAPPAPVLAAPPASARYAGDVTAMVCPSCKWEHGARCTFCLLSKSSPVARLSLGDVGARLLKLDPAMSAKDLLDQLDRYGRSEAHAREVHARVLRISEAKVAASNARLCGMHSHESEELEYRVELLALDGNAKAAVIEQQARCAADLEAELAAAHGAVESLESRVRAIMTVLAQTQAAAERWQEAAGMGREDFDSLSSANALLRAAVAALRAKREVHEANQVKLRTTLDVVEACLSDAAKQRQHEKRAFEMSLRQALAGLPPSGAHAARAGGNDANLADAACQTDAAGDGARADAPVDAPAAPRLRRGPRPGSAPRPVHAYAALLAAGGKGSIMPLGQTLDELHNIVEKKASADAVADGLSRVREQLPRFVELYFQRKYGLDKIARAKTKVFVASVLKWAPIEAAPKRRLGLFAAAVGITDVEIWSPRSADVVVSLFAAAHPDLESISEWLSAYQQQPPVLRKDVVRALNGGAVHGFLREVASLEHIAGLVEAVEGVAVIAGGARTSSFDDTLDGERVVGLVLDWYASRARLAVDGVARALAALCAREAQPVAFDAFCAALAVAGVVAHGAEPGAPAQDTSRKKQKADLARRQLAAWQGLRAGYTAKKPADDDAAFFDLASPPRPTSPDGPAAGLGASKQGSSRKSKPKASAASAEKAAADLEKVLLDVDAFSLARACHQQRLYLETHDVFDTTEDVLERLVIKEKVVDDDSDDD